MKSGDFRIRPAVEADYPAFARLFPELEVDGGVFERGRFERELVATTLVAESAESTETSADLVGYAYFQTLKETAYVRHLVTSPNARRRGIGRALLAAVAERARDAGCTTWCLNVKPDNVAAIRLYESVGMKRVRESRAMNIAWSLIDTHPSEAADQITILRVDGGDDTRVEAATGLLVGQLEAARALGGRVLLAMEEGHGAARGDVVGVAIFDPKFPGAYPFRVARPELALTLLSALRPHARQGDTSVAVVIEGQPDVADALLALGATIKLDALHMAGPLPSPASP